MKKLKLTPSKLNSDWFYQNGCVVINKNIVEYGLTYNFNGFRERNPLDL